MGKERESLGFLAEAIALGSWESAIERRERYDQESLVKDDTLPVNMEPKGAKQFLEKAGFRFMGVATFHLPLFQRIQLPFGWKKEPTSHPWLTMLLDGQNRERARIVYKAADNLAVMSLVPRFGIRERGYSVDEKLGTQGPITRVVTDGGTVGKSGKAIYLTEAIPTSDTKSDRFRAYQSAGKEAEAWLNENYPDWRDPFAYWD